MSERQLGEELTKVPVISGLSVETIPEGKRPTDDDWLEFQGGRPYVKVVSPGLSYDVVHDYENKKDKSGTGAIVRTSLPILKEWRTKTITRFINGREVEFPVALVWRYHGRPCLENSLSHSGSREIERVEVGPDNYWVRLASKKNTK